MSESQKPQCFECEERFPQALDRRSFMAGVGGAAALTLAGPLASSLQAQAPAPAASRQAKPAEALVQELYASLTQEQRNSSLVSPWNHANRLRTYNAPMTQRIGQAYTRPQQELIERILRAISSGEDGFRRLSREGRYDTGGGMLGCGANFFGDPAGGRQFAWVFSGHHLTVRCDGNSEPGAAFGGPMYYGHSPYGYSDRNVFYFQTRSVVSVYDALSEAQRRRALVASNPGGSSRFRPEGEAIPGIAAAELTPDQRHLVEAVMRDLLSPYRREDADEVMSIVRRNGGLDRLHLAFYRDQRAGANDLWHYWRLEGPGFVWNYRVLPHVHCWVNIAARA